VLISDYWNSVGNFLNWSVSSWAVWQVGSLLFADIRWWYISGFTFDRHTFPQLHQVNPVVLFWELLKLDFYSLDARQCLKHWKLVNLYVVTYLWREVVFEALGESAIMEKRNILLNTTCCMSSLHVHSSHVRNSCHALYLPCICHFNKIVLLSAGLVDLQVFCNVVWIFASVPVKA